MSATVGHGELDFDLAADECGAARSTLIHEAAAALGDLTVRMAPGDDDPGPLAEIALEFDRDQARVVRPEVLKLDLSKLASDAPVRRTELLRHWRFYWVSLPTHLWTRPGRSFNRLEYKVTFNADDAEESRPRVHDAVPEQRFAELVRAHAEARLGVGGGLRFGLSGLPVDLSAAGLPLDLKADANADARLDAHVVMGPFDYGIRVPTVVRSSLDNDQVTWRLEGARTVEGPDQGLRVVLKVPLRTERLQMSAMLRARRNVKSFDGTFLEALAHVPDKVKLFFKNGAPIGDRDSWDLSDRL